MIETDNLGTYIPIISYQNDENSIFIEKVISDEGYISKALDDSEFPELL